MRLRPANALVSCEHASNRVPTRYGGLGLPPRRLREHIAWDPGAAILARMLARRLGCPCHLGRWSRLVVDLNRSIGHDKLMAAETFGVTVPGNAALTAAEHDRRLRSYYRPYRDAATADVRRIIARTGLCVHWSMHSFTPAVDGIARDADIGLLFDPARRAEREVAYALRPLIAAHGLRVRMNYPYRGTSDGFTTQLRTQLPARQYMAFEVETNQALVRTPAAVRRIGGVLADAIAAVFEAGPAPARRPGPAPRAPRPRARARAPRPA
jgi:predicted N-formylglutamate amidohydrolase